MQAGGGRLSGEIEALSRQDAFSKLRQQNLQPFHLKIKGAKVEDEDAESGGENGGHNLSRPQVLLFTEELCELLEAGLKLTGPSK